MKKAPSSVQLSLKVAPFKAFLFRKYAEHYGFSLRSAFGDAVNSLISVGVSKDTLKKWTKEYRKQKNEVD
jgi:hypothetical protein